MTPPQRDALAFAHALANTLARYLDRSSDLAYDLDRSSGLASKLARDLDREVAGTLANTLANTLARDLASVDNLARDLHRDLGRDLASDLARNLYRDLVLDRDLASDLYSILDRDLAFASNLAELLDRDIARYYTGKNARHSAPDLARDYARVRTLARDLMHAMDQVEGPGREDLRVPSDASPRIRARRVAPSAGRLVAVTARLLPAGERARYGDEWRSELHDLAADGAEPCRQLGYAVRLLAGTPQLRRAVLAPRHGKAGS